MGPFGVDSSLAMPSGGSNGSDEMEECTVDKEGFIELNFVSKTWIFSISVVVPNDDVRFSSGAKVTVEEAGSTGRASKTVNHSENFLDNLFN